MIFRLTRKITDFLLYKGYIEENLIEVYNYGFELILSSIFGFCSVLMLGAFLSSLPESIAFLFCLTTLRRYTGGYHASSYFKCNLTLISSYVLSLAAYKFSQLYESVLVFTLVTMFFPFLFLIARYSPIENINKPLLFEEKVKFNLNSIVIFLIYYLFSSVLLLLNIKFGMFIFIVIFLIVITMIIELIKQRLISYEKKRSQNNV